MNRRSPVGDIPGIGHARSRSLGKLGIYSIQDFLDQTENEDNIIQIAAHLGISPKKIVEMRSAVFKQEQPSPKSDSKPKNLRTWTLDKLNKPTI